MESFFSAQISKWDPVRSCTWEEGFCEIGPTQWKEREQMEISWFLTFFIWTLKSPLLKVRLPLNLVILVNFFFSFSYMSVTPPTCLFCVCVVWKCLYFTFTFNKTVLRYNWYKKHIFIEYNLMNFGCMHIPKIAPSQSMQWA